MISQAINSCACIVRAQLSQVVEIEMARKKWVNIVSNGKRKVLHVLTNGQMK
jgi:hypothetical protein